MKHLYFVRHAEPVHDWKEDRTRPLSAEGHADCALVTEALRDVKVDRYVSSPYRRSCDTISTSAAEHNKGIVTDERLRERERGTLPNTWDIIKKRWNDFDFNEDGGESLRMVQMRNAEAVLALLGDSNTPENIVIGTHGTALATILNHVDPSCAFETFKRMIDYMPYIIRLDFDGPQFVGKEELLIVEKPFFDRFKNNLVTRSLAPSEIPEALRLAWDTFVEFEAPDYVPEGVDKFKACIDDSDFVGKLTFYGAFLHGLLAGILATRGNEPDGRDGHIALFFVRQEYQRRGIGKKLFEYVRGQCPDDALTVNSSPYAVAIYTKLGFVPTDTEHTTDGIRYTPMEHVM